jgi:osmotically inducible lipoprotein OsmB
MDIGARAVRRATPADFGLVSGPRQVPRPSANAAPARKRLARLARMPPQLLTGEKTMIYRHRILVSAMLVALCSSLGACAGMSPRAQNTAIGAGIGGATGSVLTGGRPLGTVGGAAIGAVIGSESGPYYHHHRHHDGDSDN